MTRDELKAFFELLGEVNAALGGLPHRDAVPALQSLQEMADIVGEQLPGGYCGTCPQCEDVKGEDEMVDCGDERICQSCVMSGISRSAPARRAHEARENEADDGA